jgi:hypothetical protein
MKAWLYDEDRWPSGFGGGGPCLENPEFRQQCLLRQPSSRPIAADEKLIRVAGPHAFVMHPMTMGYAEFNGSANIDALNPEAVDSFIRHSYEKYRQHVGDFFGDVIPGIFMDEPVGVCGPMGL